MVLHPERIFRPCYGIACVTPTYLLCSIHRHTSKVDGPAPNSAEHWQRALPSCDWLPDPTPSTYSHASRIKLFASEVVHQTGKPPDNAIAAFPAVGICAERRTCCEALNLVGNLRYAVEKIGGSVTGVGLNKAVYIRLPDEREVVVYPSMGVPTSMTLHDAIINSPSGSVAVVYDHVGLHPSWLAHLDWLGKYVNSVRWVKVSEAAWQFADWGHGL